VTEKKTFKNAYISNEIRGDYHLGGVEWRIYQAEGFGETYGTFDSSEWNMEVTFTKKVKPFKQDDQVILVGGGELAVVQWVMDDLAWVNVVASANGAYRDSHHVVKLSELKHVG
jgi:hypothetical protein